MLPTFNWSPEPVRAGAMPLAVRRTTGVSPELASTDAARAVLSEIAVTVAPLSMSIRRLTPLIEATTQKWPSSAMRTRSPPPATC